MTRIKSETEIEILEFYRSTIDPAEEVLRADKEIPVYEVSFRRYFGRVQLKIIYEIDGDDELHHSILIMKAASLKIETRAFSYLSMKDLAATVDLLNTAAFLVNAGSGWGQE